jgi:hypothetical protein
MHNGVTIYPELAGAFYGLTASLSFLNVKIRTISKLSRGGSINKLLPTPSMS